MSHNILLMKYMTSEGNKIQFLARKNKAKPEYEL